jgi:hypothetical protein
LDVTNPLTCPQQKNLFYLAQQTSDRVSQTSALLSSPGPTTQLQMGEKKGETTDSKPTSLIKGQHKEGHI